LPQASRCVRLFDKSVIEFCTYFDQRYLPRALALHKSLKQHCGSFRLHALCLDGVTYDTLLSFHLEGVELVALATFEQASPDLAAVKEARSLLDYYLTLTPAWILHQLEQCEAGSLLTYVDADLFFFADPGILLTEMDGQSVGLVTHHYADGLSDAAGRFNTGFVAVRKDHRAEAVLQRWRTQCIEWCEYRFDDGRYGDQKYLDAWEGQDGVHVFAHEGSHYGPWSVGVMDVIADEGGHVLVGGHELVAFHFSKVSRVNAHIYEAGYTSFGAKASTAIRNLIYRPYVEELDRAYRRLEGTIVGGGPLTPAADAGWWRKLPFGLKLRGWARAVRHVWQGTVNRGYLWVWRGRAL
jgi:hypothetical protein